jgi:hypothetical protein
MLPAIAVIILTDLYFWRFWKKARYTIRSLVATTLRSAWQEKRFAS